MINLPKKYQLNRDLGFLITFRVQPLFGFGDRKLSADDEVTKKRKRSAFRNVRIALARCFASCFDRNARNIDT